MLKTREINGQNLVRKRMREAPEHQPPAPASGHFSRIFFLTVFTIDLLRFEVHFICSVWDLKKKTAFRDTCGMSHTLIYVRDKKILAAQKKSVPNNQIHLTRSKTACLLVWESAVRFVCQTRIIQSKQIY